VHPAHKKNLISQGVRARRRRLARIYERLLDGGGSLQNQQREFAHLAQLSRLRRQLREADPEKRVWLVRQYGLSMAELDWAIGQQLIRFRASKPTKEIAAGHDLFLKERAFERKEFDYIALGSQDLTTRARPPRMTFARP
jgi:hypothetical protein